MRLRKELKEAREAKAKTLAQIEHDYGAETAARIAREVACM